MITNENKRLLRGLLGVYKITSPSGKIYVGSGKLYMRYLSYKNGWTKFQRRLDHSIKKHGWEAHTFEVICIDVHENLFKWERYFGLLYDVIGKNGLNLQLPKDGELKSIVSDETKEIHRKKMLGNTYTLGMKYTEEYKKERRKPLINIVTGEIFDSWIDANKKYGYSKSMIQSHAAGDSFNTTNLAYLDEEHRIKIGKSDRIIGKRVIVNKITGEEFLGVQAAADSIGMTKVLLKRRLQGYIKNDTNLVYKDNQNKYIILRKRILNKETGEIYQDTSELAKHLNLTLKETCDKILNKEIEYEFICIHKEIINVNTKEIYKSLRECARVLGTHKKAIKQLILKEGTDLMFLEDYKLLKNDK